MKMGLTKAIADLRSQPVRVALLWIAIAVGALAVMAGFGSRVVLEREIRASFDGSDPAAVVVWTDDVDASLLARVSEVDGVTGVDARRLVRARVEATDGDWRSLLLYGVRDFSNMHVSRVYPVEGQWPPPTGSVVVEQSAVAVVRSSVGEPIVVRVAGGSGPHEIDVAGIAHDPARAPGWQDNLGYAYATPETLSALGLGEQLDELHIDVAGDRDQAQLVATRVDAVMAEMGVPVHRVEVPPRKHPHADHMQAMLLLLQVLAALSLLLSALLAANLFASMLARHTRQIGVMKTLGGSPLMISRIYLALAGIVSVSASGVGAMGGVFVSQQFSSFAGRQLNLYDPQVSVPLWVVAIVVVVAASVPVAAAFVPIRRATRMAVREAIQDVGIHWSGKLRTARASLGLPVILRLSLRNSLRRRGRFVLTMVSFAVGGAMLMTAANVHRSLIGAVDASLGSRDDAIEVRLLRPALTADLVDRISEIEGVTNVAPWGAVLAGFALPTGSGSGGLTVAGRYGLLAPPDGVIHDSAELVQGQWVSGESQAVEVVVNRQLLALEPHLTVGTSTTLLVGSRRSPATIVGVVEEIAPASAYVAPTDMQRVLGVSNVSGGARIVLRDGVDTARVAAELEEFLAVEGWFPAYLMTRDELRTAMVDHFMILLVVLVALALAAVLVGVLGLSTTMSINVLERQREIGVSKAMGASAWTVRRMILAEGAATTAASLVLALALSVPLSAFVGFIAGSHGLHVSLPYQTSIEAIFAWVLLASIATIVACLGPAEQAVRRPVRHLIAYE